MTSTQDLPAHILDTSNRRKGLKKNKWVSCAELSFLIGVYMAKRFTLKISQNIFSQLRGFPRPPNEVVQLPAADFRMSKDLYLVSKGDRPDV